ncbi:MAG: hypothetical protein ABIQ88_12085 [Chitinophagaceae bacterium]
MISWHYLAVAASLLLLWLLYKEWKREKRSRLYGRLLASVLAVTSLLLMAYPHEQINNGPALKKLVVLTNGFVKDSVNKFMQPEQRSSIPIFSGIDVPRYDGHNVQLVTDWYLFTAQHQQDTFHIFGDGFSEDVLALLSPHPVVFHAAPAQPAVTAVYWKQHLEAGEQLLLQGTYENNTARKIKIMLQAFGTDKDSVEIAAGARKVFQLRTVPVHAGKAVYNLIMLDGKDTLQKEPLPVEVQAATQLKLLIISSSPDFDNTYLKNHLSQQGYQVAISTAISNYKTDRQFLNTPAQKAGDRLTAAYINKFDVLMADQNALQKLTAAELAAVRAAIRENGTGLIIKMDAQKTAASFWSGFFPVSVLQQEKLSLLQLRGSVAGSNRYKIEISGAVSIVQLPGTQVILEDAQSNIYAAAVVYGSGKIIATTLQNTYSMALAGDKAAYQQLWWLLLNRAAKKIYAEATWHNKPFIAYVHDPVQMQVEKNEMAVPVAMIDQSRVYLKQDTLLPFLWQGVFWPAAPGWQGLPQLDTAAGEWYVYKKNDWQQLTAYQHRAATKKYADQHAVAPAAADRAADSMLPVNWQLWLLIVFACACIFLWVEQKAG